MTNISKFVEVNMEKKKTRTKFITNIYLLYKVKGYITWIYNMYIYILYVFYISRWDVIFPLRFYTLLLTIACVSSRFRKFFFFFFTTLAFLIILFLSVFVCASAFYNPRMPSGCTRMNPCKSE